MENTQEEVLIRLLKESISQLEGEGSKNSKIIIKPKVEITI